MSRRTEWILLGAILLLTAVLRMGWPGLTEFKADEARLTLLALEMAEGTAFHIRGISSSVGFPNFPMSVWLYTLPLLIWKHVYAATLFTGLLNTLAVLGCYWLVRRYYGVEAALMAALMFAVSPWAIHHSRKIWAQNLLPFFVIGWGISAALAFVEKRSRWLIVHFLCLAIAAQAHLAAVALVPVTGLLLLIFWRRVSWKWTAVSIFVAALTTAPFLYYLLTAGQQFLQNGGNASSMLPDAVRGWDFSAFRFAWLLISGREIHALAGPAKFEEYLATVPDLTAVYILWGALILAGVGLLGFHIIKPDAQATTRVRPHGLDQRRDVAIILLLWLIVPILFFSWPSLPSELHYLLPIYPVPYIAVGVFLTRLSISWRRVAQGALILTAVAQILIWGQLLAFLGTNWTPNGFGTPLAMQLAATDLAQAWLMETGASEILIAGKGERPLVQDFPAIYDVLLHNVPHRFVDVQETAVFPAKPTVIFLDPSAGYGASLYQQAATESRSVPLREGEGELQLLRLEETAVMPQYPFAPPHILTNWAAFAGYDNPILHNDGTASWHFYWYTGEPTTTEFHLFTHLLDAEGNRIGQKDTAVFDATQWQQGDLVISHMRLPWPENSVAIRSGMYTFPDLTPISIFDIAGNPTNETLEISLP